MNTWHTGIKDELVSVFSSENKKDEIGNFLSSYYEGSKDGYMLHEVEITLKDDGAIYLNDYSMGENFIYLYPKQVEHLKKILNGEFK
jgi:hypothetical protein